MSHKAAKKIRKLLNASIAKQENSTINPVRERAYTENTKNRKTKLVELESGEIKRVEVSYGTMRVNSDTGRGIYKMVKRAMAGYPIVDAAMRQLNQTGYMHNGKHYETPKQRLATQVTSPEVTDVVEPEVTA